MPDKCKCVDFQVLKLQESPDAVPHGEMPRHLQLYCDRYQCGLRTLTLQGQWVLLVPFFPLLPTFAFLFLGICATKLSQGTESLSWAFTPSRSLPRARTEAVTMWAWASEVLTSVWWAFRWMWRAQVRVAFGMPAWSVLVAWCWECPLTYQGPQQGLKEIIAWVLLFYLYSRKFKPVQGSNLPWMLYSHVLYDFF